MYPILISMLNENPFGYFDNDHMKKKPYKEYILKDYVIKCTNDKKELINTDQCKKLKQLLINDGSDVFFP